MSLNPTNKPVLAVIGVGPGIGEAVSRHFAARGFTVALIARTETKLQQIQDSINAAHGANTARYYVTDVREEQQVISTFAAIKADLGPVHVLIYNAGSRRLRPRTILETPSEEFDSFVRINMFGAFYAAKCVLPDMLAAGGGTILFTGATASVRGSPGLGGFSPGKFGLRALSQVITREFQDKGIHAAHVLVDGPVQSDIVGGFVKGRWEKAGETEKLAEMDRYLMQPKDLAEIYWFLYTQPRSTWTQELDVRAEREAMFSKFLALPDGKPRGDPVVVVSLNRPEKHNAFTMEMMDAFETAYPMFYVDERIKAVVLTGSGTMFCAGLTWSVGSGRRGKAGRSKV